ncbi:hypothetical protein ROA7450_02695 [Roseovarius albus]|uniref:Uncharacterized protein n=1 Tax=Roseovarius albus TaxID=1247867 RepID=A0A1X6ZLL8_9RHOB|nr:hypothetical protein ROA7450_02695 [Roseovarius albus]
MVCDRTSQPVKLGQAAFHMETETRGYLQCALNALINWVLNRAEEGGELGHLVDAGKPLPLGSSGKDPAIDWSFRPSRAKPPAVI